MKSKLKKIMIEFMFLLYHFVPLKVNRILIFSYYGKYYGGNPKYIYEYLDAEYDNLDIIWSLNEKAMGYHGKGVKFAGLRFFHYLWTSQIVITDYRMPSDITLKKEQKYVQTWHSSVRLKQIEKDVEQQLHNSYVENAKRDSKMITTLISGSEFSTTNFKRAFWYGGHILESGTPRNDIFFSDSMKMNQIKSKIKLNEENRCILYAPTFRNDYQSIPYLNQNEIVKIKEQLEMKFESKWYFLIRLHPHMNELYDGSFYSDEIINVNKYEDIQELLYISDKLITDYSSLMFDFMLKREQCILYLKDIKDYTSKNRDLYFVIQDLPFDRCYTFDDVLDSINKDYDPNCIDDFLPRLGMYEDGQASKRVGDYIYQLVQRKG